MMRRKPLQQLEVTGVRVAQELVYRSLIRAWATTLATYMEIGQQWLQASRRLCVVVEASK